MILICWHTSNYGSCGLGLWWTEVVCLEGKGRVLCEESERDGESTER